MIKYTILLILASLIACQCQVVSLFSGAVNSGPVYYAEIDLAKNTFKKEVTNIPNYVEIASVVSISTDSIQLLYLNETEMVYYIGNYFHSNTSIVPLLQGSENNETFFAYLDTLTYYDQLANKVSMIGIAEIANATIITYDLNDQTTQYYVTDIIPYSQTTPGGDIYNENEIVAFTYNETGSPFILVSNVEDETTLSYEVSGVNFDPETDPSPFPAYIDSQLYLFSANSAGLYQFFLLNLDDTLMQAQLKLIHSLTDTFIGLGPLMVTPDQQGVIFVGNGRNDTSIEQLEFTYFNLKTTQVNSFQFTNKHKELSPFEYAIVFTKE